ncbi:glycosyltransferase family 2 protein [Achromobacter kerstersii]|jgi:putative glycosyltransferase|uniref:glycosyltransferase family 2 protein n=1 Tax=Achromobacter kerstersii TaxID=1353890 RepID=UPI0032093112
MKLSVVATLYRSAPYVDEFCRRARQAARRYANDDYEIILVNDGSPDDSLDIALQIAAADAKITVVDLSRNFGHHKAMMTGLAHATGDEVFLIDTDLEEAPEWLEEFAARRQASGCDVAYGVQRQRKGAWFERTTGQLFWYTLKKLTGMALPANITTARLMSRRYVQALLQHQEREVFMAGLWFITGFDQVPCEVEKLSRAESTYTLRKKMSLLVNSVTAFSNAPLISIFYLGLLISLLAGCYIVFLVLRWWIEDTSMAGWTSVMASIWLLGGLLMSSLGVVGIYMAKIYTEAKARPYTIVRRVYRSDGQ